MFTEPQRITSKNQKKGGIALSYQLAEFIKNNSSKEVFPSCLCTFSKAITGDQVVIYDYHTCEIIYIYMPKANVLLVFNALFCSFLKDALWGLNNYLEAKEIIVDPNTLIRTSNVLSF